MDRIERHRNLAQAVPVPAGGPVVDLGCGGGHTLLALRERLGQHVELVGVDRNDEPLAESLTTDPHVRMVVGDLNEPLGFADASFEAAVCHNTLECLPDKPAFLREVARVLAPGGHLLLSHTDFDTIVINASDVALTRRLVHAFADTQEAWMDACDGMLGRKLVAISRAAPFALVDILAWVCLDTDFAPEGAAHVAVQGIVGAARRDHHHELVARLDEWIADLRALADRGEFLCSVNDYAVLLRKPPGSPTTFP